MEKEHRSPGLFYGTKVEGPLQRISRVGDDRPSRAPRRMESAMNIPNARQIPVEGAVTGPEAPPANLDAIRGRADFEALGDLVT